ncbi:MAG: hypothetical protein DRP45_08975 [Candidatus Zixiibacteriota bacterium]|nr:MAG: hypothetical protein DRP45_08975 [candidate division Zixibacteria bacterium]
MIWLKRFIPFAVILLGWFGYAFVSDFLASERESQTDRTALITARVWIATAEYQDDPDGFIQYRDSLLEAEDITPDQLFAWLEQYKGRPERSLQFTQRIQHYVDSLYQVEEARLKAEDAAVSDSVISKQE